MDKITLPELPEPDYVRLSGIRTWADYSVHDYARACCRHVLMLAAEECDEMYASWRLLEMAAKRCEDEGRQSAALHEPTLCMATELCAAIVRDLIGKL